MVNRWVLRMVRSWLERRVLYTPESKLRELAQKFGLDYEFLRQIERELVSELLKRMDSEL